ncbi:HD domain-containing protein [Saccharopolyspora indica]|uniref:HD domain-containing protein n=1 Tax=Saccharopolyspora indica TaxID=1229659 RepID=UPI0022EAE2DC|nr:HD domain-containing protein [Saccharopolyspora indica]MDA3645466.1 HD domain-containing protein [Saccharopolyspora indica]
MDSASGDVAPAVADVLGAGGVYRDPLWRVTVELSDLERELLRSWWVRRLGFVAHAGAASIAVTQSYTRLEHSLGLLALTARFAPDDATARAAALLHDVGHLPLSHTFEGVAGLDHHQLGAQRIGELAGVLAAHGVDPDEVIAVDTGSRASVLRGGSGALKLDHLESLVRSGRAHGRTRQPPPQTLARLEVVDGAVSTDSDTGQYLAELVAGEARWLCSTVNAVPSGVVRHLATAVLADACPARRGEIAAMTDDEFWALLLTDPATAPAARALRRDPAWPTRELDAADGEGIAYTVAGLYLDMPLVEGRPLAATHPAFAELPAMPWGCRILPPPGAALTSTSTAGRTC